MADNLPLRQATGVGMTAESPFEPVLQDLRQRFPSYSTASVILIDATAQKLILLEQGQPVGEWTISTAEAGLGSRKGSNQTPLGVHRVARKFGDAAPLGTIFRARQNTGRVARILTEPGARSNADNVTTRILWLDGLEPGLNRGGKVDSHERYIYIHGTDEEGRLGAPASHGCIRMSNRAVVELFDRVGVDTLVVIARQRQ
ncbi:MAG TPA: L,D-transpeptidase [Thiolinea sp.]|nr:L,D-transpeptidase [Thiolinea sp.]